MSRKLILTLLLVATSSSFLYPQVKVSTSFETGSIGNSALIDSVVIRKGKDDSLSILSFLIESRFDPINPVDSALRPSARWYHFRMEGVKDKMLFLNIKNSEVIRPFYSYDGVNYSRVEFNENVFKGAINKIFNSDTVYISHFYPYTFSRHLEELERWSQKEFVKRRVIGESTLGLPIDMIEITDPNYSDESKKRVWIHGRSHPSEAPSSWHLEAIIDEITSDSPFAIELRKNTIFFIVPIINPDGVKGGFSRSTSTGVNIEINWDRPDSLTMPEVKALKKALDSVTSIAPLDLLLNMHSQIANSITYWIHKAESTNNRAFKNQMLLSALTINYTPYYRPQDQLFSSVAPRYVEGWMWNKFRDRTLSITFETPYTYYNEDINGDWVSRENLKELGLSSLFAVSDLLNLDRESRIFVDVETIGDHKGWLVKSDDQSLYFGESYLESTRDRAKLRIRVPNLKKGRYILHKWETGPLAESYGLEKNIWVPIGEVIQKRDGRAKIEFTAKDISEKIDSFILIKIESD